MFRTPRVVAALMLLATIICLAPAASAQTGETETVRLRLEWGSTRPEQWSGVLELSDGAFTATTSLGIGADEPGTLWIDGKSVWLQRRSRRLLDGIDVTVKASARAVLSLTLQSTGSPEVQTRQRFTLDELTHTPRQVTFGKNQARLMIQRAPGTELNVEFERPHLVFSTGESFDLTVSSIQPAGQAGSKQEAARLDWSIDMARSGQSVRSGQMPVVRQRLSDAARRFQYSAKLRLTLPADEGVYDLKLALCQGDQTRRNAVIQVVVVAAGSRADDFRPIDGQAESPIDSFDPAAPGHPRLVGTSEPREFLQKSPRFIGRMLPRRGTLPRHRNSFRRAKYSQVSWSASRLKVRNPGQPHRLVIHAESTGQAGVQGVSLLEPNAAGQLLPVGLDSGFHVAPDATYQLHMVADKPPAETDSSAVRQPVRHEILFWPKVSDPVLLLHDFGLGRPARVTRVELFELSPEKSDTTETRPPAKVRTPGGRLAGPYLHKPLLAAGLGGTQTLDEASGRSLDDWQTFLEPSRRLVQLLRNRGSNACILAVLADAGTIYPSQYLQPAPRYDSGIFFATGQDPVRKDVVELLFRLFGREGLLLIPELQFSTPLPALERQLAAGGGRECGIELTGRDGRTWRQSRGTSRGHAPCYNPLDPRVQEAVLEVVREFVARYRHHPSFGGLSLELGSSGYLQLPGLNWGYDDETIARFEQETGIRVPAEPGAARFQQRHAWLTSHGARQWTQWRCRKVADFHLRLAREITAAHATSRCLFTGVRLLHGSSVDDSVRDAVIHSLRLDALLAPKGLDFSLYRQEPRVTILRPVLSRVPQARYDVALDHSINHSHLLSKAFQHGDSGALHYHQPLECRIEDFDSVSPWQPAWTWLAAPVVHTGHRIRQSHASSLAELDAQFL
ncbi:MAG: family 10 glycosylhydrolase, partial [Planctomycetaceae bacterium]|nr:family 10 glycosylhydrolase [Planctomycetaceae bacterium]